MGFGEASVLLKIAPGLAFLGFVLHVVGFATPHWVTAPGFNFGLWRICAEGICVPVWEFESLMYLDGYLRGTQAMESMGLGFTFAALLGTFFISFLDRMRTNARKVLVFVMSLMAIIAIIAGCGIGSKLVFEGSKVSYSLGLSVAGGVMSLAAGIVVMVDKCQS